MELLKQRAAIALTHVPYKGGGPAAISVASGETVAMFGGGSVVPLIKSGKLKALAVSGAQALAGASGAADHRRALSRLRGHELAGVVRAGGHAGSDRGPVAQRDERGPGQPEIAERLLAAGAGEPFVTTPEEFAA